MRIIKRIVRSFLVTLIKCYTLDTHVADKLELCCHRNPIDSIAHIFVNWITTKK